MKDLHKLTWLRGVASAVVLAGLVVLGSSASANTITLTDAGVVAGGGGFSYSYLITYANSQIDPGDFFTINDFGPAAVLVFPPPPGWGFSQALVGPNSVPVGALDSPTILNATFTWGGLPTVLAGGGTVTFGFTLFSLFAPLGVDVYTSLDHVAVGPAAGLPSTTSGFVTVPAAVPDGGLTLALLGFALVGVEGLRRKLVKVS